MSIEYMYRERQQEKSVAFPVDIFVDAQTLIHSSLQFERVNIKEICDLRSVMMMVNSGIQYVVKIRSIAGTALRP